MVCALSAATMPARAADNLTLGTWYAFSFGENNTPLVGGGTPGTNPNGALAPDPTWTITLSAPARFTVTDVEESGDQFTFYNNGNLLGTTSDPVAFASFVGECIACALADPNFSHGVFMLPAGTANLTGTFDGIVGFGQGDFLLESLSAVPEPSTWAMLLTGLGSVGVMLRLKRRKTRTALSRAA
jgi:hypothetical protein